jgi:NADH-quinone oxidoreductase subunit L
MPLTFWIFVIGGFSLAGFPLITAGFWSKDEILTGAFTGGFMVVFIVLALTALITAFYTARQITLTFLGEPRSNAAIHAHEPGLVMTLPLAVLSFFAISAGWLGIPAGFPVLGGHESGWFLTFLAGMNPFGAHVTESHSPIPLLASLIVSLGGLYLGWQTYRKFQAGQVDPMEKTLGPVFTLLKNKYFVDEFYSAVFIRPAVWVAEKFTAIWLDRNAIDGILHNISSLMPAFGDLLRNGFDKPVISNGGDNLGNKLIDVGQWLRRFQSGRVQQYMLYTIWLIVISGMVAFYLMGRG